MWNRYYNYNNWRNKKRRLLSKGEWMLLLHINGVKIVRVLLFVQKWLEYLYFPVLLHRRRGDFLLSYYGGMQGLWYLYNMPLLMIERPFRIRIFDGIQSSCQGAL